MADLTKLESKLAEVLGLAMAAQDAAREVRGMLGSEHKALDTKLAQARDDARETQKRCTELASSFKEGSQRRATHADRLGAASPATPPPGGARRLAETRRRRGPRRGRRDVTVTVTPRGRVVALITACGRAEVGGDPRAFRSRGSSVRPRTR